MAIRSYNTVTISIVDDKPKIGETMQMLVVAADETNFVSGSVSAADANFVKRCYSPCVWCMMVKHTSNTHSISGNVWIRIRYQWPKYCCIK